MVLWSFYFMPLNKHGHHGCSLFLYAMKGQSLSSDEQIACSFPKFYLYIWMPFCICVDNSIRLFLLLLAVLLWLAALLKDCRLWVGIPGMALSTCASGRISSAMSVMCQPRRGYRLLPIFGKSLSIAPPQPEWQAMVNQKIWIECRHRQRIRGKVSVRNKMHFYIH